MFNNLIMAHRGIYNNMDIPENSLLAFKKALNLGFAIELDVEMTKDNVLVVFHDENMFRMTNVNKEIKNITYSEVVNINLLDTKEKIPTLEEVLKLVGNTVILNIEIKRDDRYKIIIDNLIKLLKRYNGNYLIQSFDIRVLRYIKKNYNNYKKGILISDKSIKYLCVPLWIKIKLYHLDFISISKILVNRKKYSKFTNKYTTFIWTIKSKEELNKYIDIYTGYICDNLPY